MSTIFVNYFAFLLLALALMLFFDILFKFKKPLTLRYLLLISSIGFFWKGLGFFYLFNIEYSYWLVGLPNNLLVSAMVLILAQIKDQKIKLPYLIYAIFIFLIHFSILAYFSFISTSSLKISAALYSNDFMTVRYIFTFITISICSFLIFKIIRAIEILNDYSARLKIGYLIMIIVFIISFFAFSSLDFSAINNSYAIMLNICMNILYVIAILYRPSFMNNISVNQ